jgi:hypothetical protein
MKQFLPLVALAVVAFSSCTSAYKTGQTPDDVYFSPTRPQEEYARVEKKDDKYYRGSDDYYEDRFLRMRVMDRYRWSALDDYYFYNTYSYTPFGNYYSYNNPWSMNWAWNAYYNPYCSGLPYYYYPGTVIIKNPRYYTPPSRAVAFNSASYNISRSATGNRISGRSYNIGGYNNSNSNRPSNNSLGESIRKVFTGSNSNNNGNYNSGNNSTPSRSYNPSSGNSSSTGSRSSGGSSSGGGGGVSRPPR